jgi:hypothetical protein
MRKREAVHKAYAVQPDGARLAVDARSIVVVLPDGELEIDLVDTGRPIAGGLKVRLLRGAPLVVGPGDGNSTSLFPGPTVRRQRRSR